MAVRADDRGHHGRRADLRARRRAALAAATRCDSASRSRSRASRSTSRSSRSSPPGVPWHVAADLRVLDRLGDHHAERHADAARPVPDDARARLVAAGLRAVLARRRSTPVRLRRFSPIRCGRSRSAWPGSRSASFALWRHLPAPIDVACAKALRSDDPSDAACCSACRSAHRRAARTARSASRTPACPRPSSRSARRR